MSLQRISFAIPIQIIIFFTVLGIGCAGRQSTEQNKTDDFGLFTRSIVVHGQMRRYAIYIPQKIKDLSVPLVFELHGGGIFIEDMTGKSGHKSPYKLWMNLADVEKFIVVYPEGLNGSYGKPTWNDCRANCTVSSDADDVAFIAELIDSISAQCSIDLNRVYVSGMSNGGLMALRLAVELSDRIAAVSTVGASMPDSSDCEQPLHPISVLFMNGTADKFLPYYGGTLSSPPTPSHGSVYPVEYSVRFWVNFDHTDTIPSVYSYPDIDTEDGGNVIRYKYENGVDGTEVILYKINGGGHSAPSIKEQYSALFEYYFGKQNHDIEMTTEVWNFFKSKRNM